jgi:phosphoglucosamine mutase
VSEAYWDGLRPPRPRFRGRLEKRESDAFEAYADHLARACQDPSRLRGRRVVLDVSNGAAYRVAPEVFRRLGLEVIALADRPDGQNINKDCGALHPEGLAVRLQREAAAFGFSFDGDGDRVIPVTSRGTVLDGDHVLLAAGRHYLRAGKLPHRTVVATVMSNIGLEVSLRADGIDLLRTDVGDRNVYLAMVERGHPVGGEQSGHILLLEHARTGDGILAALRTLDMVGGDLEGLAAGMRRYPQVLRNVRVRDKVKLESLPAVQDVVREAKAVLGAQGRVLLRYSGTEPLLRIMIEGPDHGLIASLTDGICRAIHAEPALRA